MTKTKTAIFAISIIAGLVSIGAISGIFSEKELSVYDIPSVELQNNVIPQAFAEKPSQEIIVVDVSNTDYGSGSTFDIQKVECKISTKDGETEVNWCKATGIQNKIDLVACLEDNLSCFTDFFGVLETIFETGADYDKALVEWEVEQLTNTIDTILVDDLGYSIPEDYKEKTVELGVQNNEGTETSQTKVVVAIEY